MLPVNRDVRIECDMQEVLAALKQLLYFEEKSFIIRIDSKEHGGYAKA